MSNCWKNMKKKLSCKAWGWERHRERERECYCYSHSWFLLGHWQSVWFPRNQSTQGPDPRRQRLGSWDAQYEDHWRRTCGCSSTARRPCWVPCRFLKHPWRTWDTQSRIVCHREPAPTWSCQLLSLPRTRRPSTWTWTYLQICQEEEEEAKTIIPVPTERLLHKNLKKKKKKKCVRICPWGLLDAMLSHENRIGGAHALHVLQGFSDQRQTQWAWRQQEWRRRLWTSLMWEVLVLHLVCRRRWWSPWQQNKQHGTCQ